jgi:putative FmdB family regulatory protein
MPTYEYKCDACGHAFEKFQAMTAAPVRKCPVCGKAKVRKLISAGGGMIFKGSGFYITDYRSEGYQSAANADRAPVAAGEKGDGKAEVKSEPKPETKAESKSETKAEAKAESKPAVAKAETKPAAKSEPKASKSGHKF